MERLISQVAVVTGASRGIGRAIAEGFAREGARVVCAARSEHALNEVVSAITDRGGDAAAVFCDVTDARSVRSLVIQAEERYGFVDTLVNNAGAYRAGAFLDQAPASFRELMEINLMGTVSVTSHFLPQMLERRTGRIINIASTAGKYGSKNQSAYNASKHAVVGLTRSLALEVADTAIRVNAICPGFVATDLIDSEALATHARLLECDVQDVMTRLIGRVPIGRILEPEEIAELAIYLASDAAAGMTGQALTIDGGLILI
jgi:NAD(P)-dependent dehydrogenase (short-subunit alcohol dehydrogenase family)